MLLSFNGSTGQFSRLVGVPGTKAGPVTAKPMGKGYLYVGVDGRRYLAHRLAWLWAYGHWPKFVIDHINMNRTDNRIANLRDVVPGINNQNIAIVRRGNKSSGRTGVSWHIHSCKWRARIVINGVEKRLGLFDTVDEASNAYLQAKRKMHEGCTI